ncbi:MAG TPA: agmatinase [bacterium]|nr:agmatinase [bacterium]HQG45171.1 agmatinase [bacterium]HQI48546.1 agmatinase [bacterium]HQJ63675.1 agmatinase [bacterium]
MKPNEHPFLAPEPEFCAYSSAAAVILPFPYEGGVSYGHGTAAAPRAILEASAYVEFYDEVLKAEPYRMGIATVAAPQIPAQPEGMIQTLYETTQALLNDQKFVVVLGGDHSISSGYFKALLEKHGRLSCIQLDAHSDLREEYEGNRLSHASVMARIREMTPHALQLGIRAQCLEEALAIAANHWPVCTMHDFRKGVFDVEAAIATLPDPVFITVDVDAFDLSIIHTTGTPEPGGFTWDEALDLLEKIFMRKNVVGFDLVELAYDENDRNSAFCTARLAYKMLGLKLAAEVARGKLSWPKKPAGAILES